MHGRPSRHAREHGKAGIAQALDGVAVDDEDSQRDVEHAVPEDEAAGIRHDLHLAALEEETDKRHIQHTQDEEGCHAVDAANAQRGIDAPVHTLES